LKTITVTPCMILAAYTWNKLQPDFYPLGSVVLVKIDLLLSKWQQISCTDFSLERFVSCTTTSEKLDRWTQSDQLKSSTITYIIFLFSAPSLRNYQTWSPSQNT
jgi:hypothetical protein